MSFCRFGWDGSDVYVFQSDEGYECCGCRLVPGAVTVETPEEMIGHLAEHKRAGHFVPEYAITGLFADVPGPDKPPRGESPVFEGHRILAHRLMNGCEYGGAHP